MLEGPDPGCGGLGRRFGVMGDLVPGLADARIFEERCHGWNGMGTRLKSLMVSELVGGRRNAIRMRRS